MLHVHVWVCLGSEAQTLFCAHMVSHQPIFCFLQATLLPSLLSLSNFAKNNSLGSLNSHNLADLSTLPSVPGDEQVAGKGSAAVPLGQAPRSPARGGDGIEPPDWGQQRSARDPGHPQDAAGPSGRGSRQDGEKEEDSEQYMQGMFFKQLQQQRQQQQQQKREVGPEAAPSHAQHVGLGNPSLHDSSSHAVAHFNQLQRSRTPPGSPYNEPHQGWSGACSNSPMPELDQARARPPSGTHRDPRNAFRNSSSYHESHEPQGQAGPSSPRHEQFQPQGRASSGSPRHAEGRAKPSTFLSELAQAIEPSLKGREHR